MLFQSTGGVPCHFCGNCTFQDHCNFYNLPDCLSACLFWDYMGSNCRGSVPFNDYAFGSCETIHFAQVFQSGTPSRFRCCRVWRGTSFIIQPSNSKFLLKFPLLIMLVVQWYSPVVPMGRTWALIPLPNLLQAKKASNHTILVLLLQPVDKLYLFFLTYYILYIHYMPRKKNSENLKNFSFANLFSL